jgi:hypothetical protein
MKVHGKLGGHVPLQVIRVLGLELDEDVKIVAWVRDEIAGVVGLSQEPVKNGE